MKVIVTHLKAPWPAGAAVGSVVELLGDTMPGCFVGKCTPAEADAEATHAWEPQAPAAVAHQPEAPASAEELETAKKLLVEAEAEADELRGRLERALGELDQVKAELVAAASKPSKGASK